jgi:hypothetical protein
MTPHKPTYDFTHPVFRKMRQYIRFAKEHLSLLELNERSDVIFCEPVETSGPLRIPTKYHVHYRFKSIVSIDENEQPVYGDHHIMEITLPPRYPLEACKIYMVSDAWHPNIKSQGRHKGRICGNLKNFGKTYDLYQLVLRVGEILQYKNYHAIHVQPFPEDSTVAHWVTTVAEPQGIVNKEKEVFVDDTPLINVDKKVETEEPPAEPQPEVAKEATPAPTPAPEPEEKMAPAPEETTAPKPDETSTGSKIRLGSIRKAPKKKTLKIRPKKND